LDSSSVIIGKELALYLGAGIGSMLSFYSANGKAITARVAGIFNSGMYDYDMNLVFSPCSVARHCWEKKGLSALYPSNSIMWITPIR